MGINKQVATIDCAGVLSEEEFWQRYLDSTKPSAPRDFGRNLDAFWDAISGGGPGYPANYDRLHFKNLAAFIAARPEGAAWFESLQDIARRSPEITVTLTL